MQGRIVVAGGLALAVSCLAGCTLPLPPEAEGQYLTRLPVPLLTHPPDPAHPTAPARCDLAITGLGTHPWAKFRVTRNGKTFEQSVRVVSAGDRDAIEIDYPAAGGGEWVLGLVLEGAFVEEARWGHPGERGETIPVEPNTMPDPDEPQPPSGEPHTRRTKCGEVAVHGYDVGGGRLYVGADRAGFDGVPVAFEGPGAFAVEEVTIDRPDDRPVKCTFRYSDGQVLVVEHGGLTGLCTLDPVIPWSASYVQSSHVTKLVTPTLSWEVVETGSDGAEARLLWAEGK